MGNKWGNQVISLRDFVKNRVSWKGAATERGFERGRISTVRSRYQRTTGEDTACCKIRSVCYGDL
jgi:hypothetical protein